MVYFRAHQPRHTPKTFPLEVHHSFSDKHPQIAKAMRITGITLAALSLLAVVACVIAVSAGGAAIPLAVIGGIAAMSGLLSAATIICSAKKALAQRKQKQLEELLPLDNATEHVNYLTSDTSYFNQWESLDALNKQLSQIDLTIQAPEKKLLKEVLGSRYDSINHSIEEISDRFTKMLSLLRLREHFCRGEERYAPYLSPPLLNKNRLLTQITSNMIRMLPKSGGVFSLKANTLSHASRTLYTVLKVALSLGVLAGVAALIIFLPPSLPFIAVIGVSSLALGMASFLMIRGIKYLLEHSPLNRKQLAKDIQKTIIPDVLASMVHYQHQLLSHLHETLLDEAITARWSEPFFIEHANLKAKIEDLTKQYDILNAAFNKSLQQDEALRSQLEKRAYLFPIPNNDENAKTKESQLLDSENDSNSEFQEIINKGLEAANKRRADAKSKFYTEDETSDKRFSIWKPTKNLALEDLWRVHEACNEEQQALLLEDYMSYKTSECQAALQKVSQELKAAQKSFAVLEKHALDRSYESSVAMMDLARANQETHRLLNILSELQQLAQYMLDNH